MFTPGSSETLEGWQWTSIGDVSWTTGLELYVAWVGWEGEALKVSNTVPAPWRSRTMTHHEASDQFSNPHLTLGHRPLRFKPVTSHHPHRQFSTPRTRSGKRTLDWKLQVSSGSLSMRLRLGPELSAMRIFVKSRHEAAQATSLWWLKWQYLTMSSCALSMSNL